MRTRLLDMPLISAVLKAMECSLPTDYKITDGLVRVCSLFLSALQRMFLYKQVL